MTTNYKIEEEEEQEEEFTPEESEVSPAQQQYTCPHCVIPGLGYLQPDPTQLLTLQDSGGTALTLELDSAATLNYVSEKKGQSKKNDHKAAKKKYLD